MSELIRKERPEFRNIHITQILKYRLPLAGRLSILHRASGILLFLALPLVLLPVFERSLTSELSFMDLRAFASAWWVKGIFLVLIWAYLHHFCAGIRFLLLDLHIGIEKDAAHKSAAVSLGVSLALTVLFGLKLFGAF